MMHSRLQFKYGFQGTKLISPFLNPINSNKMASPMKESADLLYPIKCGVSSFIATYVSGVMHPLDVVKTRFQSHDGRASAQNQVPKYSGVFKGLRNLYKYEGFSGLYKGFYVSLLSQALATALFFLLYERRKTHYEQKGYATMSAVSYSSIEASVLATLITQPIWVIKTRMLLNIQPHIGEIENAILKTREIYQQSGYKGFTKGLGVSLLLSFNGVMQMYIYEGSKRLYVKFSIPESRFSEKTFFCGSLSKLITILFTYPLTTIRTRIQQNQYFNNRTEAKYSNVREVIAKMVQGEGFRGFYKGMVANLMKGLPQRGIYFYSYQWIKAVLCNNTDPRLL